MIRLTVMSSGSVRMPVGMIRDLLFCDWPGLALPTSVSSSSIQSDRLSCTASSTTTLRPFS